MAGMGGATVGMLSALAAAVYIVGNVGSGGLLLRVMLPQAVPILVSCFLFSFVWQWTDIFYTRLFLPTANTMYLSMRLSGLGDSLRAYLANTAGVNTPPVGRMMQIISTGVLITAAPLILIYIFAQRWFIETISSTGLKD